jgi:protein-disulfide isomerase
MNPKLNHPVAAAILIGAALVAAALVYLGYQWSAHPDEERIAALIDRRLESRDAAGLSEEEFNARVERGILAFIEKQRRAEAERPQQLAKNVAPPDGDDFVYGDPDAPVALIEYSDFECPFCKRFHATAKRLVDDSGGRVKWIYRHFPLASHNPGAQKQAEAAECAAELGGNDAFWRYANAIYERTASGGKGFPLDGLEPLAREIGLDGAKFRACLDSGRMAEAVERDLESGARAGVNGTPGNILLHVESGRVLAVHGAQPYEVLQQAVDTLIKGE